MSRKLGPAVALTLITSTFWLTAPQIAQAQGLLVPSDTSVPWQLPRHGRLSRPMPPAAPSYRLKSLQMNATLVESVARVQIAQSFVNTGPTQLEVSFVFPIPPDAAVDQLTLMVNGKEIPGRLLKADDARRIYEETVRRNRDPALLEWMGWGMFKTSVFPIPPGQERTVTLRYSQVCRADHGLVDFLLPMSTTQYTSQAPEMTEIRVALESHEPIKSVYSSTHAVDIKRTDDKHALVTYTASNLSMASDFRLFFDTATGPLGARLLSYRPTVGEDGYFLLLATPEIPHDNQAAVAKTVLFVLDKSGSMAGDKIEQARNALKFVLNNLRAGDLFNIITYDSDISSFRPELQKFDSDTRAAAMGYVDGIYAGGNTNIDGALKTALSMLKDRKQPSYVIFLTDGMPTTGETNEMKIAENAHQLNQVRARVFNFGVGFDVNSRLLDRLARINFGDSEYVRPNENIEAHVSRLYSRIGSPALTDVTMKFEYDGLRPEEGDPVNRVYPKQVMDLFAGDQLVMVGRYRKAGAIKVSIQGRHGADEQKFDFPADLVDQSADQSMAFIEKLWAARRIGEILDELDLKGRSQELINELVALSTKHGIITPYTSFLADERNDIHALSENTKQAAGRLNLFLSAADGRSGVAQRQSKGDYQKALVAGGGATSQPGGRGLASDRGSFGQTYLDADDREVAVTTVLNIANKTMYCRDFGWIDSTVTEEQRKSAVVLAFLSDDYFKLSARYGGVLSQVTTFDRPVYVNLGAQCYRLEPPPAPPAGK